MRQDRVFFWIIAVYFAAHTVLRTALGGAFEVDEAEMFVLAQDYRLGYGPQAPLYNWLQATAFHIFGANTFAVSVTKNLLLFATYTLFFDGLRRLIPSRLAIFGTLALLLLPNLSWEGQRAGSHTIAMLAVMAATFNVMARRIEAPEQRWHAVALGITLGLGGIAKYNFWLFPLTLLLSAATLPQLRQALIRRDLWLSVLIAIPILTLPVGWMILHPDQTLASTYKFHKPPEYASQPLWVAGHCGVYHPNTCGPRPASSYDFCSTPVSGTICIAYWSYRHCSSLAHPRRRYWTKFWSSCGHRLLSFGCAATLAFACSHSSLHWLDDLGDPNTFRKNKT